jgi:predicted metalloprotease
MTAAALLAAVAMPVTAAIAEPVDPSTPGRIEVTRADVDASNQKVGMAYGALAQMWANQFKQVGARFVVPQIARYTRAAMTGCGVIRGDNAEYCPSDNTIYYDEVFVAGMAKAAANELNTDGDMAAVGIIAHEMGHAVAMQLGHRSRSSYENEATADCLAGAFTQQSQKDGNLEKGDIEEAFYGMSLAGDPTPESTGNQRVDRMIQARLARQSHGTKEQRMQNFRSGLEGGPQACLAELGGR